MKGNEDEQMEQNTEQEMTRTGPNTAGHIDILGRLVDAPIAIIICNWISISICYFITSSENCI